MAAKVVSRSVAVGAPTTTAIGNDADGLDAALKGLDAELHLLPDLRHRDIVAYIAYHYCPDEGAHVMIVEEMERGILADTISLLESSPPSAATFMNVALAVVLPSGVVAKLGDFGVAVNVGRGIPSPSRNTPAISRKARENRGFSQPAPRHPLAGWAARACP